MQNEQHLKNKKKDKRWGRGLGGTSTVPHICFFIFIYFKYHFLRCSTILKFGLVTNFDMLFSWTCDVFIWLIQAHLC